MGLLFSSDAVTAGNKILILGASGYVGRNMMQRLGPYNVIATFNHNHLIGGVKFDSLSMRVRDIVPEPSSITGAVVLLGDTRHDSCARDKTRSQALNVDSVIALMRDLRNLGIFIVFASTDNVFDGRRGNYTEEDTPNPIVTYGRQKVEVERFLESEVPDHAIVRLSKVYGRRLGDKTLFTDWVDSIRSDRAIRVAVDQIFSAVFIDDVIHCLPFLIARKVRGIFHLGGPQGLSRVELLDLLLAALPDEMARKAQIERCGINDFDLLEPRPLNCSMRSDKITALTGVPLTSPADVARMIAADLAARDLAPTSFSGPKKVFR